MAHGLGEFQFERWYCALAVRSPIAKGPVVPASSVIEEDTASAVEEPPLPSTNRKAVRNKRRTFIYHTKDPIAYVEKLNHARQPPLYKHEVVSVMGPLTREYDAKLIKELWNYRSRSIMPRSLWAELLARHFDLCICHDMQLMLPLKHFTVQHRGDQVYLVPK